MFYILYLYVLVWKELCHPLGYDLCPRSVILFHYFVSYYNLKNAYQYRFKIFLLSHTSVQFSSVNIMI